MGHVSDAAPNEANKRRATLDFTKGGTVCTTGEDVSVRISLQQRRIVPRYAALRRRQTKPNKNTNAIPAKTNVDGSGNGAAE